MSGTRLGGDKAFAFSSLISRRSFSPGLRAFFFLAGLALALAGFLWAFVNLALVLGLAPDFAFVLDFAIVFFAAGVVVATAGFTSVAEAVVLTVEDFFLGELVVRPVWAFGLDTASVAYVLEMAGFERVNLSMSVASWFSRLARRETRVRFKARAVNRCLSRHWELHCDRRAKAR